jgi:hypothetical protein
MGLTGECNSGFRPRNPNLPEAQSHQPDIVTSSMSTRLCIIIGYNSRTKEIATSDSCGKEFEERWLTLEEATAPSQPGEFWKVER